MPPLGSASPILLNQPAGRSQVIAQHAGTRSLAPSPANRLRYTDGGSPMISRKVRLNVPRLAKPTSKQISVTGRWVSRSSSIARSTRGRCRYLCGVSPKVARNWRLKCAGETCATRAKAGTSRACAKARSIVSRARSILRLRSSTAEVITQTQPAATTGGRSSELGRSDARLEDVERAGIERPRNQGRQLRLGDPPAPEELEHLGDHLARLSLGHAVADVVRPQEARDRPPIGGLRGKRLGHLLLEHRDVVVLEGDRCLVVRGDRGALPVAGDDQRLVDRCDALGLQRPVARCLGELFAEPAYAAVRPLARVRPHRGDRRRIGERVVVLVRRVPGGAEVVLRDSNDVLATWAV